MVEIEHFAGFSSIIYWILLRDFRTLEVTGSMGVFGVYRSLLPTEDALTGGDVDGLECRCDLLDLGDADAEIEFSETCDAVKGFFRPASEDDDNDCFKGNLGEVEGDGGNDDRFEDDANDDKDDETDREEVSILEVRLFGVL